MPGLLNETGRITVLKIPLQVTVCFSASYLESSTEIYHLTQALMMISALMEAVFIPVRINSYIWLCRFM